MSETTPCTGRDLREAFEELESGILAIEGMLEIITPYTADEGQRSTLRREDVAWALTPAVRALRQALDQGWQLFQSQAQQGPAA